MQIDYKLAANGTGLEINKVDQMEWKKARGLTGYKTKRCEGNKRPTWWLKETYLAKRIMTKNSFGYRVYESSCFCRYSCCAVITLVSSQVLLLLLEWLTRKLPIILLINYRLPCSFDHFSYASICIQLQPAVPSSVVDSSEIYIPKRCVHGTNWFIFDRISSSTMQISRSTNLVFRINQFKSIRERERLSGLSFFPDLVTMLMKLVKLEWNTDLFNYNSTAYVQTPLSALYWAP